MRKLKIWELSGVFASRLLRNASMSKSSFEWELVRRFWGHMCTVTTLLDTGGKLAGQAKSRNLLMFFEEFYTKIPSERERLIL